MVFRSNSLVVTQAVIEKVPLPFDLLLARQKMFPAGHDRLHSRLARKRDNGVQMIRHQQEETTMPRELIVIVGGGSQHRVADAGLAKLVLSSRGAIDRDEEERAV